VDNLSNGRVGLSFASGWHASDFALAPANFKERREIMARGIETVKALWRGEPVPVTTGDGKAMHVKMYPPPVQREPRIWVTSSSSPETFAMAGRVGASVLTNLLVMKPEELAANIAVYRKAYREAGHTQAGRDGHVTLMLHTFVGNDMEDVRARVRGPFLEYLRTSTDLINKARWELTAFAKGDDRKTGGSQTTMDLDQLSREDMDAILAHAFERYFTTAGLFGTPETCLATVERLREIGVDEIACLVDFGVESEAVLASLPHLDELRRRSNEGAYGVGERAPTADEASSGTSVLGREDYTIAAQIRRHGVTHLQCTPSLLGMLVVDDEALSALGALRMLLVGGEALPPALVQRVRAAFRGTLRNMYGPTETTVWSTSAIVGERGTATPLEGSEQVPKDGPIAPNLISIGRPIANTHVYVVNRHLHPLPIGVAGELLIGGAGVVRGYLGRPELTAERFVTDSLGVEGARESRLYRTGDLVRWLPSGELEFLGRIDHQVKIRGYRIELGEIESALASHPSVRENVVVARREGDGESRLVAYVVPREEGAPVPASPPADVGAAWRTIWDETYKQAPPPGSYDTTLNTVGWKSSYTDQPIPEEEMREWVEATAGRVLAAAREASPSPRVLEIGSGTGMLLFRVAPVCSRFVAVDFSETAVAYVAAEAKLRGLAHVSVEQRAADSIHQVAPGELFDAIVVNSVIQYFPSAEYLVDVLRSAYARLAPGGALFVGDVRSLLHARAFHTAVELARAASETATTELSARVRKRGDDESELLVDPRFFAVVAKGLPDVVSLRCELKSGRARNELTRFRYDVVLRKQGTAVVRALAPARTVTAPEDCTLDRLRALLADEPVSLAVLGIQNARVIDEVRAAELLAGGPGPSVADLRAALTALPSRGLEPDDVRALAPAYDVEVSFSLEHAEQMDVIFRHRSRRDATGAIPFVSAPTGGTADYTNVPSKRAKSGQLVPVLRAHLRERLPEFMLPSAFVLLPRLPLTPNGKVDRGALPAPDRVRQEAGASYTAPAGEIEKSIAAVLQELLAIDRVGIDDNFFDLGANSLMMVQASVRLRTVLGRNVALVEMFQYPTVRSLAGVLGSAEHPDARMTKEGQERAQARKDAMLRRREQRLGARTR
jgi:natural product biosynthesis luciferase-like monooxygenase protein